MKVLFSNCRGLGNQGARAFLREFCVTHTPDLLCVAELFMLLMLLIVLLVLFGSLSFCYE